LIVLKHVGNSVLKEYHPSNKPFDVQLICYLFTAFFNIVHKLPFKIRFKPFYEAIKIILEEAYNVDGSF
jgi:hypothetical protein